jgi:hypothetical protein
MAIGDNRTPLAIFGGFNLGGADFRAFGRYQWRLIRQAEGEMHRSDGEGIGFWFAMHNCGRNTDVPMAHRLSVHAFGVLLGGMLFWLWSGTAFLRAEDDRAVVRLNFPKTDVRDVLAFYGRLVRKPMLVELDVQGLVTLVSDQDLPHKSAVELIQKTLLESYGIEMREDDRGEVLVRWSSDPKYLHRSDAAERKSDGNGIRRRRIQLLDPAENK